MAKNGYLVSFVTFLDIKNDTKNLKEDTNFGKKLQGGLNTICVKFSNPAPRFERHIKKKLAFFQSKMKTILSIASLQNVEPTDFLSKKMSLDGSTHWQNPVLM